MINRTWTKQGKMSARARLRQRQVSRRRLMREVLEPRVVLDSAFGPQLLSVLGGNEALVAGGSAANVPQENQLNTAPPELTFRFDGDQALDAATLAGGIRITRSLDGSFDVDSDGDGLANDEIIKPAFIGFGESQQVVVARFAQTLPRDIYRVEVFGFDDGANGITGLRDTGGDLFQPSASGANRETYFLDLKLGTQVVSVLPQPVLRDPATGQLSQAKNQIQVHFDSDNLDPASASKPAFYRLINAENSSLLFPQSVDYDAVEQTATLVFEQDIPSGTFQLQIGTSEETNDTTDSATSLGTIAQQSTAATYEMEVQKDADGNPIPRPIPDGGVVLSTITVLDSFLIDDVNVEVNIDHEWGPDLRVFLQAPGGQRVELLRDLGSDAFGGQIYGVKFHDLDEDGVQDEDEPGLAGWTIFIDSNNNAVLDPGERSTVTNAEGRYAFVGLEVDRTYRLAEVVKPRWQQTVPTSGGIERLFAADFSAGSQQTLRFDGSPKEGTFRLGYDGRTTAPVEFVQEDVAALAANIETALAEILDAGIAIKVTPVPNTPEEFTIEFSLNGPGTPVDHPIIQVVENLLNTGQLTVITMAAAEGFTSSGPLNQWHLTQARGTNAGHTGLDSFYFGAGENQFGGGSYANRADGTLVSPEIDLSQLAGNIQLTFNHLLNTESGFDFAEVRVLSEGDRTVLLRTSQSTSGFEPVQLNLTQFQGKKIQLEFNFTSDSSITQEGWYIDDVRVGVVRGVQSVALSSAPQGSIIKNARFGSTRGEVVGPDQFGYEAFGVPQEFEDITETGQRVLQQFTSNGFATGIGGTGSDRVTAITADATGNVYVAGSFQGTVDFDPSSGTTALTSSGADDIFVAKFDSSGALLWARQAGGSSADVAAALQVDTSGNVYVTGSFSATADFDPSAGTFNLTSAGATDAFVAKLDANGNFVWAHRFGGTAIDAGTGIALAPNGDVAVSGYFSGSADFDPGAGQRTLTSDGGTDAFVLRLSEAGNLVWVHRTGGTGADRANAVTVDASGNVTTTGAFSGTVDFNSGTAVANRTSAGSTDGYVQQLDASGAFRWVQSFGGSSTDRGTAITSGSDLELLVTGASNGDIFVAKFTNSGGTLWNRSFGGTSTDIGEAVAVDSAGNVFVAGSFRGTVNFGGGDQQSAGGSDVFLLSLDPQGNFSRAQTDGGALDDSAAGILAAGATVLLAGSFRGSAAISTGPGDQTLTTQGLDDGFFAKIALPAGVDDEFVQLDPTDLQGFEFDFYGQRYNGLFFNSNGLITFGTGLPSGANTDLLTAPTQASIAAFWEDLLTGGGEREAVFWEVRGPADDQRLIVQWNGVQLDSPAAASEGPVNFQAVLRERDGSIQFNYVTVSDVLIERGLDRAVGTFTRGAQNSPAIASDDSGNYVVVWNSPNQDGDGDGIFARRYDSTGSPLGGEFQVSRPNSGTQRLPHVAMNGSGRFVVVWHGAGIGDSSGIFAQVYDDQGTAVGTPILVNAATAGTQLDAKVGIDSAGRFTVAWHGTGVEDADGVYVRRFDAQGQPRDVVDEIQRMRFLGPPGGATSFTLIHNGVETGPIAYAGANRAGVTARNIENALRALSNTGDRIDVVALATANELQRLDFVGDPTSGTFVLEFAGVDTAPIDFVGPTDEQQTLTFRDNPNSGTFTLTFAGVETGAISYAGPNSGAATAANIEAALEALGTIGSGNVVVTQNGSSSTEFVIRFTAARGESDQPQVTVGQNILDQGTLALATTTAGLDAAAAGALTASNIQAALEALPNIGTGNAVVRPTSPTTYLQYTVQFIGPRGGVDHPLLQLDANNLDQGSVDITEVVTGATRGIDFEVRFLGPDGGQNQPLLVHGDKQSGVTHLDFTTRQEGSSGEILVNNLLQESQKRARLDVTSTGAFSVAWESAVQDGDGLGVFAKRYDENGITIEEEFDELQRLVLDGPPNANSRFRLRLGDQTTGDILYAGRNGGSVTAENIEAALQALGPVYSGISVTAEAGVSDEVQSITFTAPPNNPTAGTFRLAHRGLLTAPIAYAGTGSANGATTAANIQAALRALANTGDAITVVPQQIAGPNGPNSDRIFIVTFAGVDGDVDHPPLVLVDDQLNRGTLTVDTIEEGGKSENEFLVHFQGESGRQDQPLLELASNTGGVLSITAQEIIAGVNSEFRVNMETLLDQASGDFVVRRDGSFFITWRSTLQDGDGNGIFGKLYSASGDVLREEFQINTFTQGDQQRPRAGVDLAGNLVVTWVSRPNQDGDDGGIFARRIDADGNFLGDEFPVNELTAGDQAAPGITVAADGSFRIVFQTESGGGGIHARSFDASGLPLGPETQVSEFGLRNQTQPVIARSSNGNHVVVWQEAARDSDLSQGIYAQVFDASQNPLTGELQVAQDTDLNQILPSAAIDANGNFVVVWRSQRPGPDETTIESVRARQFAFDGTAITDEITVNASPVTGVFPDVAMDASTGEWVVVWDGGIDATGSEGILARLFDSAGNPLSGEFVVNTVTEENQFLPRVARNPSGSFVVTWSGFASGTTANSATVAAIKSRQIVQIHDSIEVFGRRFAADGSPLGDEFRINEQTGRGQWFSDVSLDDAGNFVVVWEDFDFAGFFLETNLELRRFDATGQALSGDTQVNDPAGAPNNFNPRISTAADGTSTIVWDAVELGDVLAQRVGPDGGFIGSNFVVPVSTAGTQFAPSVSAADGGRFLVAWVDDGQGGQGVFTQEITTNTSTVGIKDAGVQNVGENVLQIWTDGSSTSLVGDTTSTRIALRVEMPERVFAINATTGRIEELDANSGSVISSFVVPQAAASGAGLAFAGGTLYYTAADGNTLFELNPDNGAIVDTVDLLGAAVRGLGYLNGEVVLYDAAGGELTFIDPFDNAVVRRVTPAVPLTGDLAGSGSRGTLFALNTSSQIIELDPADGSVRQTLSISAAGTTGLAFADGLLLVADSAGQLRRVDPDTGTVLSATAVSTSLVGLGGDGGGGIKVPAGGNFQPFVGTILDDEAAVSITQGFGPYTGRFRPIEPLNTFDFTNVRGNWRLRIEDTASDGDGVLHGWKLLFNERQDTPADLSLTGYVGDNLDSGNAPANDVDLYQFDVLEPGTITINLAPVAGLDGVIRLFDEAGTPVATVDAAGDGAGEQLVHQAVAAGIFFVGVSSRGNSTYSAADGSGASGGTGTGSYSLTIDFSEPLVLDDDNSSFDTAILVGQLGSSGHTIRGQIRNGPLPLDMPGGLDEPGHRHVPPESHFLFEANAPAVPNRIILGFEAGVSEQRKAAILEMHGLEVLQTFNTIGAVAVKTVSGADIRSKITGLEAHAEVRYAEPDLIYQTELFPNDPRFGQMYGLDNIGQTGGSIDADIDAPEAWDTFTGSPQTVVAVIDTGVDYNHPDLAANMWRNPGEIAGDGIDNDANGYVDDIFGIDTAYGDSDPMDVDGHGTHVAGTIAAVGDNGVGTTGISWNSRIMALRFLNDFGFGTTLGAIEAIDYMTTMKTAYGVNIVVSNNSWGGGGFSQALQDAIQASNDAGILFVAASGNSGRDTDAIPQYPSSYALPGIISVAATDDGDLLAGFSNFGSTSVDIAAPGVGVISTTMGGTYGLLSGTSMATPHVAGVAALLAGFNSQATAAAIKDAILLSADPLPNLTGKSVTGGRLNAAQALSLLGQGSNVSTESSIETAFYNFQDFYGTLPSGDAPGNAITENQKQRAREIFELYGHFLGIQFVETADQGLTVVTGDMRAVDPTVPVRPGGVTGISDGSLSGTVIMDASEDWGASEYGGGWFQTAMHEIGHAMGLGHSYDLPNLTIMGGFGSGEPIFPGDHDIVHGRFLYPPDSTDLDIYRFDVTEAGWLTAETIAERLRPNASLLDTKLILYRETADGGVVRREVLAQNDDYYSNDSYLRLHVQPGTYYVAVASTGNRGIDPAVSDTGFGGTTEGDYELSLNFDADPASALQDSNGVALDGDADGTPGGRFNFWFESGHTIFVDKLQDVMSGVDGDGSLASPYDNLASAVEEARTTLVMPASGAGIEDGESFLVGDGVNVPVRFEFDSDGIVQPGATAVPFGASDSAGVLAASITAAVNGVQAETPVRLRSSATAVGGTVRLSDAPLIDVSGSDGLLRSPNIIRMIGNGGTDGDATTLEDNLPYLIGVDNGGAALVDGDGVEVPQGVTLMIDAGALIKLQKANIDVGSSAQGIDRRGGALQVLGTPGAPVSFRSFRNDEVGGDSDGSSVGPQSGDWGGLVFRADSDREDEGIFLNWVNHAALVNGGGKLTVGSVEETFTPVHLVGARPTISHNLITASADAAISADPLSFEDSESRIGPDIQNNLIVGNSINGLFIRIRTRLGEAIDRIDLPSRFDDTDIVHVLTENLLVSATPGGPILDAGSGIVQARHDGRLAIDPGVVVKVEGARIEALLGAQLIIEGSAGRSPILTSVADDSFGASGAFDTKNDLDGITPAPGQWGGVMFNALSKGSLDHVLLAHAGGNTAVEGGFDRFNAIEIHQGEVRIANSTIRDNAAGVAASNRNGRGSNAPATVFVRGAQPIIVNNVFRDNTAAVLHINANSLQSERQADWGRTTGPIDVFEQFADNRGPLARLNRLQNNGLNGMQVRGGTLTTQSIWDDTDIAHVLLDEIQVLNHHTFSGLTLQSGATESLVVKLAGASAGFTANGTPLDIDDRIGGSIYIVSTSDQPVILTSLADDSATAGFDISGRPLGDTNNDGPSAGAPGQWRSLLLDRYSNDRNVEYARELEPAFSGQADQNRLPSQAQFLGNLAPDEKSGDENKRLGFEVHGHISLDRARDVDVYSFNGVAGAEVWFDIDRTAPGLDTILELIDANGTLLARSLDNRPQSLSGAAVPLVAKAHLGGDFYTINEDDAGMRVVLPGRTGESSTYYVRVRSTPAEDSVDDLNGGLTRGDYQLQIRLRQVDEKPGSTIRGADIRYATNGIEVRGLPKHSPLVGESAETRAGNDSLGAAQPLGNLLASDRNAISVGGAVSTSTDVDWYSFTLDYDLIQANGFGDGIKTFSTIFDIDYADGLARPDTVLSVFDQNGNLILVSRDSNVEDDQPGAGQGADTDDLTRGSFGTLDPYIGSAQMPAGIAATSTDGASVSSRTYYVAVSSNSQLPTALNATFTAGASNSLIRLEPVNSVERIAEDHVGFSGYSSGDAFVGAAPVQPTTALFDISSAVGLATNVVPFTLNDVVLYVGRPGDDGLRTVNPFTGQSLTTVGDLPGNNTFARDFAMRSDGRLFMVEAIAGPGNAGQNTAGRLVEINPGTGAQNVVGNDGIPDFDPNTNPRDPNQLTSPGIDALAFLRTGFNAAQNRPNYHLYYAVQGVQRGPFVDTSSSTLYRANPDSGSAAVAEGQPWGVRGEIFATSRGDLGRTTGMAFVGGMLFGVSDRGLLYRIDVNSGRATGVVDVSGVSSFTGLSAGPQNLEAGRFANMLFATTNAGQLIALSTAGARQPVFAGGASEVNVGAVQGLAFSPLDFNLWHPTERRGTDAGHGINRAFDESRNPASFERFINGREMSEAQGGASFYFGLETWQEDPEEAEAYFTYGANSQYGLLQTGHHRDLTSNPAIGNNYDLPGGALGSLATQNISLSGYTAADKPTLYFNYFLETQNKNEAEDGEMRDSARVLVSTDGGASWQLLATNNSVLSRADLLAELPRFISPSSNASAHPRQRVQELFDNTGGWRQARVDLSEFAGASNVAFRFDFSTAGTMNQGVQGDSYGDFFHRERGLQNNFEGFYVDDVIVGFAERGEMVTASGAQTQFFTIPQNPDPAAPSQVLVGDYQLELRRGTEYGATLTDIGPPIALFQSFDTNDRLIGEFRRLGDQNAHRDQGQLLILGNTISDTAEFGILVDAGKRDANGSLSHPGGVRKTPTINNERLVTGVNIENNVVTNFGQGGILYSGDPNAGSQPLAAVPFGRIMNNTIYGGTTARGAGIRVSENASPTILNNIVANTASGVSIDATSSSTVVGANLYQGNTNNGTVGSSALLLGAGAALFVDPANRNFYLAPGSQAIDSSLNSLPDRPSSVAVKSPLGIPPSPILAPDRDRFRQLRLDDPSQDPPPGLGSNIFKDRGAIERADFDRPLARLVDPVDNDGLGGDLNPAIHQVLIDAPTLSQIVIRLVDTGIGIDDRSVTSSAVSVERDGQQLQEGTDYDFTYSATNNLIILRSLANSGQQRTQYVVTLDNSAGTGIQDEALNLLAPNQPTGETRFTVITGGFNDPPIPVNDVVDAVEDVARTIDVATNDRDPDSPLDPTSVTIAQAPTSGTAVVNADGTVRYQPSRDYVGTDFFTYTIKDSEGLESVQATVLLTVHAVNDPPLADPADHAAQGFTVSEDLHAQTVPQTPLQIDIASVLIADRPAVSAADELAAQGVDFVELTALSQAGGTVQRSGNQLLYTPPANYFGPDTIFYRLGDTDPSAFDGVPRSHRINPATGALESFPDQKTTSGRIVLNVTPVNDPPTIGPVAFTALEDLGGSVSSVLARFNAGGGPGESQDILSIGTLGGTTAEGGGFQFVANAGGDFDLTYTTPANGFFGQDTFVFTIVDTPPVSQGFGPGDAETITVTATVTVRPVNDAPIVPNLSLVTVEEQSLTITGAQLLASGSVNPAAVQSELSTIAGNVPQQLVLDTADPNNPAVRLVSGPTGANVTRRSDGSYSLSLPNDYFNRDQSGDPVPGAVPLVLSYRVTDQGQSFFIQDGSVSTTPQLDPLVATGTVSVSVFPVNDPPTGGIHTRSTTEDATAPLLIDASSLFAATPAPQDLPGPGEANQSLRLRIAPGTVSETSAGGQILAMDTDGDGVTDRFAYTPAANFASGGANGPDFFEYQIVDDGQSFQFDGSAVSGPVADPLSATGTLAINVTPVNDPPVFFLAPSPVLQEDNGETDGGAHLVTIPNFVVGVRPGPSSAVDEADQPVTFTVTGGGSLLTAGPTGQPAISLAGAADSPVRDLQLWLAPDAVGTATITVTATDGAGGDNTATRTFTLTVNGVNDPPEFTVASPEITTDEDAGVQTVPNWATAIRPGPVTAVDEAGQEVSFTVVAQSGAALFSLPPRVDESGQLQFAAAPDASGTAIFSVSASDRGLDTPPNRRTSEPVLLTITIKPINDAPVAQNDSFATGEDQQLVIATADILSNDQDADGDTLQVVSHGAVSASGASITVDASGTFTYDPSGAADLQALAAGQTLNDTFTYTISDGTGAGTSEAIVTVTVTGVNDAPVGQSTTVNVGTNRSTVIPVLDFVGDIDGLIDPGTVVVVSPPSAGNVQVLQNGSVSYRPNNQFVGIDSFSIRVRDEQGAQSNVFTFSLNVNEPPVAQADDAATVRTTPVDIDVLGNDSDPDGEIDPSTLTITSQPQHGTASIVIVNGVVLVRYTADSDFPPASDPSNVQDQDEFTYTVRDASGTLSNTAVVRVDVLKSPARNPDGNTDVDADGFTSPRDALLVINLLNRALGVGQGSLPVDDPALRDPATGQLKHFYDVDGNERVQSLDALRVINQLNRQAVPQSGEGEAALPSDQTRRKAAPETVQRDEVVLTEFESEQAAPIFESGTLASPLDLLLEDLASDRDRESDDDHESIDEVWSQLGDLQ